MRIDKYLWAVRIYKSRSIAAKECNSQKVKLNGEFVKAAKDLSLNDTIEVKVNPIWRKFRVVEFPKSRVGAKLTVQFVEEITDEASKIELQHYNEIQRQMKLQGFKGRPSKRDRRKLDDFKF